MRTRKLPVPPLSLVLVAMALATGLIVRGCLLFSELWLDEVWSLQLAGQVVSPLDLLLEIRHDNNHILNTAFLWLLGPGAPDVAYRGLSLAAGLLTVAALCCLLWRHPSPATTLLVIFASLVPVHVLFSTEARGYAPMLCFATLAFLALLPDEPLRASTVLLVHGFTVLGLLSHFTFVHILVALVIWHAYRVDVKGGTFSRLLRETVLLFLPAALLLVTLYSVFIRSMTIGGGPVRGGWLITRNASRLAIGWCWENPWIAVPGLLVVAGLGTAEIVLLRREGRPEWVFFLVTVFVSPAALQVVHHPLICYARYFTVSIFFAVGLLALALARMMRGRRFPKVVAVTLATVLAMGHLVADVKHCRHGRGGYLPVLELMARQTEAATVTIAGDSDFRHQMMISHYAGRIDRPIRYFGSHERPAGGTDWVLLHDFSNRPSPRQRLGQLHPYRLVHVERFGGISGWNLFVYRRVSKVQEVCPP